jgi:hypothetical protein
MNNVIDYSFDDYKRTPLFLKKQYGADIPGGWKWKCPCGNLNDLSAELEQWCPKCGTRLRIQTEKEKAEQSAPGTTCLTIVRVAHITVRNAKEENHGA